MATAEAKLHVAEFTNEPFIDFSNADNRKKMEEALEKVKSEFGHEYPMWIARQESDHDGEEEVHQPVASLGSDWRFSGCVEGTGDRGH